MSVEGIKTEEGAKPKVVFSCAECGPKGLLDKNSYVDHLKEHQLSSSTVAEALIKEDSTVYPKDEIPRDEIKDVNLDVKFSCGKCGETFFSESSFVSHVRVHKESRNTEMNLFTARGAEGNSLENSSLTADEKQPFSCNQSDHKSVEEGSLRQHILTKHTDHERPYSCIHCGHKFTCSSTLKDHVKANHLYEPSYSCHHCDYDCVDPSVLKKHIMYEHTGERPYSCSHCEYKCVLRSELTQHFKQKHPAVPPFSCSHCSVRFVKKSDLNKHKVTDKHKDKHPYSCSRRDYKSVLKSVRKPTREQPYSCILCDYECATTDSMKFHIMAKHTNERPYSCSHCDYTCVRKCSLKRHIKANHTDTHASTHVVNVITSVNF